MIEVGVFSFPPQTGLLKLFRHRPSAKRMHLKCPSPEDSLTGNHSLMTIKCAILSLYHQGSLRTFHCWRSLVQYPDSRRAHRVPPFHPESKAGRQVPGHSQVPPSGLTGFTSGLHFPQQAMIWAHGTHGRDGTHSSSWVPQHAALPKLLQKGKQKALGSCSHILKTNWIFLLTQVWQDCEDGKYHAAPNSTVSVSSCHWCVWILTVLL